MNVLMRRSTSAPTVRVWSNQALTHPSSRMVKIRSNIFNFRTFTEFKHRWEKAGIPPHNITPIIGSVHVALNRDFVDFCIHDDRSYDFQKYLVTTFCPDELFFSSLNHNPHLGILGTFTGTHLGKNEIINHELSFHMHVDLKICHLPGKYDFNYLCI